MTIDTSDLVLPRIRASLGDENVSQNVTAEDWATLKSVVESARDALVNGTSGVFNVKDYGAVGDGVTNDQAAFVAASDALEAADGGVLLVPPGTYLVGGQTFAGTTGLGYAYRPDHAIEIANCTMPVLISGYGAKLKTNTGLKFGGFHPETGASDGSQGGDPTPNYDYSGGIGSMVVLTSNNACVVEGLVMDGQGASQTIGGLFGNTGRQCPHDGVRAYGNAVLYLKDLKADNFLLDGYLTGYTGLTASSEKKPIFFENCHGQTNGRQGWSLVGGNFVRASNCSFNKTGRGAVTSAPGAGIDIEEESSIVRDVVFDGVVCEDNYGPGLVTVGDVDGVKVNNSTFWGSTTWAVWVDKPNVKFSNCKLLGRSYFNYANGNGSGVYGTQAESCLFDDPKHPDRVTDISGTTPYLLVTSGNGSKLRDCTFNARDYSAEHAGSGAGTTKLFYSLPTGTNRSDWTMFRDCKFVHKDDGLPDTDFVAVGTKAHFVNCTLQESYVSAPATGYVFFNPAAGDDYFIERTYVQGPSLKWYNASSGAGGHTGWIGDGVYTNSRAVNAVLPNVAHAIELSHGVYNGKNVSVGTGRVMYGSAAPVAGTWAVSDIVLNSAPTAGSPLGWRCTVAGAPGTWEAFYFSVPTGVIQDDSLPGSTTTSATHVDLFTGTYAQTRAGGNVLITVQCGLYATAVPSVAGIMVTYDGVAAALEYLVGLNTAGHHVQYCATFKVAAAAAAGNKTVALQWRRVSGSGTLTTNTNNSAFITVIEVA